MSLEDQELVSQQRIDEFVKLVMGYKSREGFNVQEASIISEWEWLTGRGFSFGNGLMIDGAPAAEGTDNNYALYLLTYGFSGEEGDDEANCFENGGGHEIDQTHEITKDVLAGTPSESSSSFSINNQYSRQKAKNNGFAAAVPEQQPLNK